MRLFGGRIEEQLVIMRQALDYFRKLGHQLILTAVL